MKKEKTGLWSLLRVIAAQLEVLRYDVYHELDCPIDRSEIK